MVNLQGQIVSPTYDSIIMAQRGALFDEFFTSDIVVSNVSGAWPIATLYSYLIINTSDC
jgi:hypothetical protein